MAIVCLQGGGEFSPDCAEMDRHLLDLADGGPVVVVPLAAPDAGPHGVAYYRGLGAADVTVGTTAEEVRRAALVVLPGGSPSRLAAALPPLADAVASRPVVTGASAGAMLLCGWALLPEDGLRAVRGLGLAEGLLVLPHYEGGHADWVAAARRQVPADVDLLGLPEGSGVVVDGDRLYALGREHPTLLTEDGELTLALGVQP